MAATGTGQRQGEPEPFTFLHHPLLGTMVEVRVGGAAGAGPADRIDAAVVAELQRLERVCSVYDPDSELQRWKAGAPAEPGSDLATVLAAALRWQVRSGGRFNVLAGLAVRRWRHAEAEGRVPGPDELAGLAAAMADPPFGLDATGRPVATGDVSGVDLNAFAKGWIVDRALEAAVTVAASAGVGAGDLDLLVNAGGDLRHSGSRPLRVGIENPLRPYDNEPPLTMIGLGDAAVATSGRARRGFQVGDRWYGHVIDPRTAAPVDTIASISVVAPDAATADVLATVLGVEPATVAVERATEHGVACLVVEPDGRISTNERWDLLAVSP